ncbi:MAG: formylglycine-generating enzyme family protein [Planctomycetes bacterium]|nr:formylglycine-generating enzyme family protein [Planctomycetota bacterium]
MPELGDLQRLGRDALTMEFLYVPVGGEPNEKAFWIAKQEVTLRQYADFIRFNPEWRWDAITPSMADADYLKSWNFREPDFVHYDDPVVFVSFFAAEAFCKWADVRLPKVEEWRRTAALLANHGFERLATRHPIGNWTATVGKGTRRLIAGIDSDPEGHKPTAVSPLWGFRCAVDE